MVANWIKNNKFILFLLIVLVVGLVLRLFVFNYITTEYAQDSYWFMTLGKNFIQTFRFELTQNTPYDRSQPLYPILIGLFSIFIKNLFINGKIISLLAGLGTIIFTYLFWKKIENKSVAILASLFVTLCALNLFFSVRVMSDMLFTFFIMGFFYFFYKSLENEKLMPVAAIFLVFSALTRWEGYLLIPVALISLLFLKRKDIFKKEGTDFKFFETKYFIIAAIIVFVPLFLWSWRSHNCCGSFIPSYGYQKYLRAQSEGGPGIDYIKGIFQYLPLYFLIFLIFGLVVSFKKFNKYLPVYLYLLLSLILHTQFRGQSQQFLYVTSLIYGFFALFFVEIGEKLKNKGKFKIFLVILIIFLAVFTYVEVSRAFNITKFQGGRQDVIKASMEWLAKNANSQDKILIGDSLVYSSFTKNPLMTYDQANYYVYQFTDKYKPPETMVAYAAFLTYYNVSYFVAYDSTMPWFYTNTKQFAKAFERKDYQFQNVNVSLIPLNKFDLNKEELILYKVEIK